jgi:hypothetical protein
MHAGERAESETASRSRLISHALAVMARGYTSDRESIWHLATEGANEKHLATLTPYVCMHSLRAWMARSVIGPASTKCVMPGPQKSGRRRARPSFAKPLALLEYDVERTRWIRSVCREWVRVVTGDSLQTRAVVHLHDGDEDGHGHGQCFGRQWFRVPTTGDGRNGRSMSDWE